MSYCPNEKCIKPQNVQITLRSVFEFIRQNQITTLGFLSETTILLKISLTNLQVSFAENRQSASNIVTGIVTDIADTYVVLLAKTGESEIYSEYTVEYNKIVYLENYNIYNKYNEFVEYLTQNTPRLCYEKDNQYLDMLESLKRALRKYKNDETVDFKIIFSGVNSRRVVNKELEILRNLVIFEKVFIFPITTIGGYIIAPICNKDKESVENNSESQDNKEKGGVLNV